MAACVRTPYAKVVFGTSDIVCSSDCRCKFRISCLYLLRGAYDDMVVIGNDFAFVLSVILRMRRPIRAIFVYVVLHISMY